MIGVSKSTLQKIIFIALSAMTVSMVLMSVFNYEDGKQKDQFFEHETSVIHQELKHLVKSFDYLAKKNSSDAVFLTQKKAEAQGLIQEIEDKKLKSKNIVDYRSRLIELRRSNQKFQGITGGFENPELN